MATGWMVGLIQDETLNDSDKIITLPENTEWEILSIWVEYTSSAVAGNRQLEIQFQSSGSTVIAQWQTAITQAESLTYKYLITTGVPDLTALRDTSFLTTPMTGNSFLFSGQKLRIWDNNAVDPTADDMIVQIEYGYHDIA